MDGENHTGHGVRTFQERAARIRSYRFLASRRITQAAILFLFVAGNMYGWNVLTGNLSAARLFGLVPLTDPFALLQVAATHRLFPVEALTGAIIVMLFYAAIAGRAFCSWVCPLNIATDAANWLRRVLKTEEVGKTWWINNNVRYWVLALSVVLSALLGIAAFEWISPVSMLHRGIIFGMGFGWASLLLIFLFDLFAVKNGFCGHLCPLGAFYSLIGRFSLLRVAYEKERCTLCMKCTDICPEKHVLSLVGKQGGMVLSGECVNCGRCIEVCNDNALKFVNKLLANSKSK